MLKVYEEVKKNQIFGIEYEDGAFGLSSTNMLIHGDGNSNVVQDSMFKRGKWIEENNINIVLMNPPYNATKNAATPITQRTGMPRKKKIRQKDSILLNGWRDTSLIIAKWQSCFRCKQQ